MFNNILSIFKLMKIRCQCTRCYCKEEFELITKDSFNRDPTRIGKTVCIRCENGQHWKRAFER